MCITYMCIVITEVMSNLLTICIDYILHHIDLYSDNFSYLPVHIKNRILKRLQSVKTNYPNIIDLYRMLIHPGLKKINLSLYDLDDNLIKILGDCYDLETLILTENKNSVLTEKALLEIIPNFNKLVSLEARFCFAVTDNVIKSIVVNCPKLSEIDIAGCRNISDITLQELSKLTNLKALDLSRTKISNTGIKYLIQGHSAPFIKELRLSECDQISHIGINLITEKCKSLEYFVFANCTDANEQTGINFETDKFTNIKQLSWTVFW